MHGSGEEKSWSRDIKFFKSSSFGAYFFSFFVANTRRIPYIHKKRNGKKTRVCVCVNCTCVRESRRLDLNIGFRN